ncbi:MAG: hypothetical protein J6Y18_00830 [Candidatus Methanomethylophilaceae archaeon]|nr:hypothetical protein [Candidatus Methanomethylophilaceae archaeon]
MFGYTFPIEPMMSSEDQAAYRAYYCETCHQLRDGYGVMSTVIVSYEMTFANIILNSVLEEGVIRDHPNNGKLCVLRHSDTHTDLLKSLAAYTVLVANNGLVDDKVDGPSLKSNLALLWLNRSIERARKDFPEYDELIMKGYGILREKEAAGCSDPLEMGKASAASMIWVLRRMIGDRWTPELEQLFENMGIWVYVMDALEDLDDDFKEKQYNPFLCGCDDFTTGKEYISKNIYRISGIINSIVTNIQSSYLKIREKMRANQTVTDNIIYQGIPVAVRRVMAGESKMQPSVRNLFSGRINRSIGSSF